LAGNDDSLLRFEQAVLPHLSAGYNLARWILRDQHDAEDVVQQACLRACRAFGDFRGSDVRAWLLTIVRNACYSELRRRRGRVAGADALGERDIAAPEQTSDPQAILLQRIDREALAGAIDELPEPFREVFVLREMEQLSYAQIAEMTGIPVGTVMSRLARARRRLAQALGGDVAAEAEERET
jgi:RNA polymerase sigma-70 factor (ECF subfamily)